MEKDGVTDLSLGGTSSPGTRQKALRINLDPVPYGAFAEIGAGQEAARWFFRVGGAAGTVAKTMSAYDMAVSDAVYGPTSRYVSRRRLEAMLEHEYDLLLQRLAATRGAGSAFFVFADTVATRSFSRRKDGDGWMGVRFQAAPGSAPSDILIHVHMCDREAAREQEALGILGVNLLYGAFYHHGDPTTLIASLLDNLGRERVEVDMIKLTGPCYEGIDNRLMSLELVERGVTDATMFNANGEVVQPSEVLYDRPVLVERGSFRPVVKPALDMLKRAREKLRSEREGAGRNKPVVLMEMTLRNLSSSERIEHRDFLALADILGALGETVMISIYGHYHDLATYLRQYTRKPVVFALGGMSLQQLLDERYYADLDGGILEAFGRLFRRGVRLYVYPYRDQQSGQVVTVEDVRVAPEVRYLYAHLLARGVVQPIHAVDEAALHISPGEVLRRMQQGDPAWEGMVPEPAVPLIKACGCLGFERAGKVASPPLSRSTED
ncbi:MAG: TonB-dependent receptor [Candidatus Binatia bacterium]